MPATCIVGLQWGDEAKGKVVDLPMVGAAITARAEEIRFQQHRFCQRERGLHDAEGHSILRPCVLGGRAPSRSWDVEPPRQSLTGLAC